MKQRRGIRRIIIRAGVFLLVGAIVNIAVAWGLALLSDPMSAKAEYICFPDPDAPNQWAVSRCDRVGSLGLAAISPTVSPDAIVLEDPRVPRWSRIHRLPGDKQGNTMLVLADLAYGWPRLALWNGVDAERDFQTGSVIRREPVGCIGSDELPVWVLPSGFAINTLFYATILWLLFIAPFALRRMRRLKRGLCPACAYPVGTSDLCAECGKPLSPRKVEPAPS